MAQSNAGDSETPDGLRQRLMNWAPPLILVLVSVAIRILVFPLVSGDLQNFVIGWYEHVARDGTAALTGEYANYNVAYIYALYLPARLLGIADPIVGIKLLSTIFDVCLASAVAILVSSVTGRNELLARVRSAAVVFALPTVLINSSWWGQCDAGYTTFAILAVAAAVGKRSYACYTLLGCAFAFKLQAFLLLPAIGALSLFGWLGLVPAILVPVVFLASLTPAWLLGRPLADLLGIYVRQGETFRLLSASAPNPWTVVPERRVSPSMYVTAVRAGLAFSTATGFAFLYRARASLAGASRETVVKLCFVSVFLFPYVLPKMHDRYFFMADILSVVLALIDRRHWRLAVAVQIGSLTAYMPFLTGAWQPLLLGLITNGFVALAVVFWLWPVGGPAALGGLRSRVRMAFPI